MRTLEGLGIALSVLVAACGGKIAGEGSGSGPRGTSGFDGPAASAAPSASATTEQPTSPFGPAPSASPPPSGRAGLAEPSATNPVADACAAICARNGECGADQPDCKQTCADEIRGAASCSAQASAYIQCYAQNLATGCAALPPVCEGAYCAYTICAGKVVPDYCR